MKSLAYIVLMSFVCLSGSNLYAFSGGTGSSVDPFLVSTPAELNSIGANTAYWASYFKLTANIDMSGYIGTSYNIIGSTSTHFTGGFNGNGFVISNLTYTAALVQDYVGMFGYTDHAYIQNMRLTTVNISSSGANIGGLIGYQYYGTTINCSTTGSVSGGNGVGGLAGNLYGDSASKITYCSSTASVTGPVRVGGLIGIATGPVSYSYSTGTVTANSGTTSYIGGLIGDQYYATVNECFTTSTVNISSTSWAAGGFTGNQGYSTMTNCYCTGTINGGTGNSYVGGLIGWQYGSTVANCYSTSYINVSSTTSIAGLIGYSSTTTPSTITACFWDTTASGKTDGVGNQNPDPAGAMGRTTAQMKTTSTFTAYSWDFTTPVWVMPVETVTYPVLAWQPSTYGGGQGTSGNPWKIYTKAQLEYLGSHTDDYDNYFILMADIDLAATTYTKPIIAADTDNVAGGHQGSAFKGDFNGNNHIIRNVTINAPDLDYVGLFGWVYSGAKVRNLAVENVAVAGRLAAGGMIGANSGQLTNCHTTGLVSGSDYYTGGLAGWNGSVVTGCYSTCEIDGYYYNGGLAGFNSSNGTISNSFTNSTTNGKSRTGGLVGANEGTISGCFTLGATQGYCFYMTPTIYSDGFYVGGLCGENLGTISSCYARGEVTRNGTGRIRNVGGLVGWNNQGKVIRCYSSGAPSGTSSVGGLVGAATTGGAFEDTGNFWDTQTSATATSAMGTGKTTAQMKAAATFAAASWDFTTVWAICEAMNYPKLRWQAATPGNFVCPDEVRMEDLAYIAKRWLRSNCASTSNCEGADLDLSGAINAVDLLIVADNWLQ